MNWKRTAVAVLFVFSCVQMLDAGPGTATISGKVTLEGAPPKRHAIDMSRDPECANQYATAPQSESVVTGQGNGLENVVVYVTGPVAGDSNASGKPVMLDQSGCRYIPRVVVMRTGQELWVKNHDNTVHNVFLAAKANPPKNFTQMPAADLIAVKLDREEFIPVKCNVHPWMRGTVAVLKNSFFAVTDKDGAFKLPPLPPGTYTIKAWHEVLGEVSQSVTIQGNGAQTVQFVYKGR